MRHLLALTAALVLAACLGGCADETVYDWQRPHETYQVGAFSKAQNADALKAELARNGFDSRVETEIKNGQFYLNVLVDVYDKQPDTLARLERISGVKPHLRGPKSGAPATGAAPPAPAIPAKDI